MGKNKEYIIGIISILMLASSISIFIPFISNHVPKHSKNSLLSFKKKYSLIRPSNNNNQTPWTLINKLFVAVNYITNSVITNQNKLKYMIIGKADNKDDKSQSFQLATLNKFSSIIGINKYSREAVNTINNSIKKLQREDKKINSIISIIKNHPYTYQSYLCNDGIIIPNVDFFFNEKKNISNLKVNRISNNSYTISNSNPSINNVSLSTEEATFSAKTISESSMSLGKVLFNNVSFTSKIITFNTKLNEYQFANTTKKYNPKKNNTFENIISKANNSEYIKSTTILSGNLSNLSSYRTILTQSLSKNYALSVNTCGDTSGNNYLSNNNIFKLKDKKISFPLLIISSLIIVLPLFAHLSVSITLGIMDLRKNGLRKKKNINTEYQSPSIELEPVYLSQMPTSIENNAFVDVTDDATSNSDKEDEIISDSVTNDEISQESADEGSSNNLISTVQKDIIPRKEGPIDKFEIKERKLVKYIYQLDTIINNMESQESLVDTKINLKECEIKCREIFTYMLYLCRVAEKLDMNGETGITNVSLFNLLQSMKN